MTLATITLLTGLEKALLSCEDGPRSPHRLPEHLVDYCTWKYGKTDNGVITRHLRDRPQMLRVIADGLQVRAQIGRRRSAPSGSGAASTAQGWMAACGQRTYTSALWRGLACRHDHLCRRVCHRSGEDRRL